MNYGFNNTNIITGYIKELLRNFNLPTCPIYKGEEKALYNRTYLNENYFITLDKKDGVVKTNKLEKYSFGNHYSNLTKRLTRKSNYYDQYTHEYLGDYLRFIRDYRGIDLMTMYNCFSNYSTRNLEKYLPRAIFRQQHKLPTYGNCTYYILPVKFNQTYTICLESPVSFDIFLIFNNENVNNERLFLSSKKKFNSAVRSKTFTYNTNIEDLSYKVSDSNKIKFWSSFVPSPEEKLTDIKDSLYWTQEENLRMVIKLPSWVNTSITVLEEDLNPNYKRIGLKYFPIMANPDEFDSSLSKYGRNSLLENYSINSKPFADRLIEYLLDLAITPIDQIPNNVGNIQKKMYGSYLNSDKIFKGYFGLFDNNLRAMLFKLAIQYELYLKDKENVYKVGKIDNVNFPYSITGYKTNTDEYGNIFVIDDNGNPVINFNGLNATQRSNYLKEEFKYLTLVDRSPDLIYYVDKDMEGLVNSL